MTSTLSEADVPDASTLRQIVGDVFTGLLGTEVEAPFTHPHTDEVLPVIAAVAVSGGWSGAVVFSCSGPLARQFAGQLLETQPDEVSDDDLRDVVGEVANVIGGNVKSVMPGPSSLSLPQTSLAGDLRPLAVEAVRLDLAWHNEPMRISVWSAPTEERTS